MIDPEAESPHPPAPEAVPGRGPQTGPRPPAAPGPSRAPGGQRRTELLPQLAPAAEREAPDPVVTRRRTELLPDEDSLQPPTPFRILAITNSWPEHGELPGSHVVQQIEALRTLGHQVDVEVVGPSRGRGDYVWAAGRVAGLVRRARKAGSGYDLVHLHSGATGMAGRLIPSATPRVLSYYDEDPASVPDARLARSGRRGTRLRLYSSRGLRARHGDPGGVVLPRAVDFATFAPGNREAIRAAMGISEPTFVVLFGGQPVDRGKGHDIFLDVMRELRERGLRVREIVLVDEDPPPDEENPQAPATSAEVAAQCDAADLLLFTSRPGTENSPAILKFATAMGLPVVATAVGDVTEILHRLRPGAMVPWRGEATRAELVTSLADASEAVLKAGQRSNGRQKNAWLDAPRIARRLVQLYADYVIGDEPDR